jgi:ketopantoate reductase
VPNEVQRHVADNHSIQRAVISMGAREGPGHFVLGQHLKGPVHPRVAVADVTEELSLIENSVRKGESVLVKRFWRFPRIELPGEVVVEGQQRAVSQEPSGAGLVGASSGHRSVFQWTSGQSVSAASIRRIACSKLVVKLCTNGLVTP